MTSFLRYYLSQNSKNSLINELPTMEKLKKEYISYLLKVTDKNILETAKILNISRSSLYQKLNKYKI
jgi:DNA-binding NtrC family response regulator